jgi:predicted molibdopterin-dependent oxidoreductase YjgC
LTNEEAYVLQRLARGVLGTSNLDHGAGLSYRALLDGLQPLLGYAAATNGIREIRHADAILAVSANFKQTHPVAKNEVVLAAGRRRAQVIVVDHVRTSFCDLMGAEAILVPPGTEGLVVRGMIRCILDEGLWDRTLVEERTGGLDALREVVASLDLATVAKQTGVTAEQIQAAARVFAQASTGCILMALDTLSVGDPVDLARSLACLALLVGKVGRPGCGLHIYGEKANSQGALDMGIVPELLPGYGSLETPEDRATFEDLWGVSLPTTGGRGAYGMLDGCREGKIRSLYVVGENPAVTYPDRAWVKEALARVEFLVVQDLFLSETAERAHVVLPVASFVEKEGTFTSVDRRIQRIHRAIQPFSGLRTDLEVFGGLIEALDGAFPYQGPSDVLEEIGRTVPLYRGVRWDVIPDGGLAWPLDEGETPKGTHILYAEGFPNGKARLELGPWKESALVGDEKDYPWVLHPQTLWFHSGSFSTRSPALMDACPGPWIVMHREDAREQSLNEGDRARVVSPRGSMEGQVVTRSQGPKGIVQVPHHFPDQPLNRLMGWTEQLVRVRVEKV